MTSAQEHVESADPTSTSQRLRGFRPRDGARAWLISLVMTAAAFALRVTGLGFPNSVLFDETYYAKDAWALLQRGYETDWSDLANAEITKGDLSGMRETAAFIVHPPVGKLLIAAGEAVFGMNSFGWRIAACVFGSLLVLAVFHLARRLSRSTLVGAIAALLITVDGLSFVLSRLALLDIFEAFFLVVAVFCVVADRDWLRERLARYLDRRELPDLGGRFGPVLLWRPWRLAAGVTFGLACGVKWNAMYVLAAMCVMSLLWDVSARRLAGAGWTSWWGLVVDGIPAFVWQVLVAVVVYVSTWFRWLTTPGGWDRQWGRTHPDDPRVKLLGRALGSLVYYHQEIYAFHTGDWIKSVSHPYAAHPAGWLLMVRTIGIDAVNDIQPGTQGCPAGGDTCLRVVDGMGTPLLWWFAAAALVAGLLWWLLGRDWRFSVPLVAAMGTYIPWFFYADRALFFFYAITIIPFTAIGLAMAMGKILGPAENLARRQVGGIVVGSALCLIVLNFAFIYPVVTDALLPRWQWAMRMWLNSWI